MIRAMRKGYKNFLIGTWIVVGTLLLALGWLNYPAMYPDLPEPLWQWLRQLYGLTSCEDQADLELMVRLSLSFMVISLLTFVFLFLWRGTKPRE